jgi:hypothetical protein
VTALAHESRRLIGPLHGRLQGLCVVRKDKGVLRRKGGRIRGQASAVNAGKESRVPLEH